MYFSLNRSRFLIIYEDFNDYIASARNFATFDTRSPDDFGVGLSSSTIELDSPDFLRGTVISNEAGRGATEKERATMIAVPEKEEAKQEDKSQNIPGQINVTTVSFMSTLPAQGESLRLTAQGESLRLNRQKSAMSGGKPSVLGPLNKRIFVPKALCLLSRHPFFDYFRDIIEDLYRSSKNHVVNVIEGYINKLVLECPAPPRGLAKVKLQKYSKPKEYFELSQPPINQLPYVNASFFDCLFRNLNVDIIV